jgi:hypothetical protein
MDEAKVGVRVEGELRACGELRTGGELEAGGWGVPEELLRQALRGEDVELEGGEERRRRGGRWRGGGGGGRWKGGELVGGEDGGVVELLKGELSVEAGSGVVLRGEGGGKEERGE